MGRSVTRVTDRPKRTHADQRTQKASTPLAQALLLPCSTATHHSTAALPCESALLNVLMP